MAVKARKRVEITRGPFDPGGQPDTHIGQGLELGFFGWNIRGGMTVSKGVLEDRDRLQDYWKWSNSRHLVELAERAGFDYQVPFARWIGQGGETDFNGAALDFLASAAATAPITERLQLFSTTHITYRFHPLHIAKFGATIDHMSNGRWGLNIVSGYSAREMAAFGFEEPITHDVAYDMADEFTTLLKHLWHETEPFDFVGDYYKAFGAVVKPGPTRNPRPVLMNAGTSAVGMDFGARQVDWVFTLDTAGNYRDRVKDIHQRAASHGRTVRVATMCWMLCEATDELAQNMFEHLREEIDTEAVLNFVNSMVGGSIDVFAADASEDDKRYGGVGKEMFEAIGLGFGSPQIVGGYDSCAEQLRALQEQGIESLLICFFDPQKGIHQMEDEIIPRLKKMGIRK
jgi:FMNH2-dependent dimethyl sulfone monooxygenase